MAKQKYYVVWKGYVPGVYTSWEACKRQVEGFEQALYKSFSTHEEAEVAFKKNPWNYIASKGQNKNKALNENTSIIKKSISVDAACSGNPGLMEYRGVWTEDGKELFHLGPLQDGTNNIGEFLAIVHALALQNQKGTYFPIYTDSINALKWVEKEKCNTKLMKNERNAEIFVLIERAEKWLRENTYSIPILKWNTRAWGEIPADFGRK